MIAALLAVLLLADDRPKHPWDSLDTVGAVDLNKLFETPKTAAQALGDRAATFMAAAERAAVVTFESKGELAFRPVSPALFRKIQGQLLNRESYRVPYLAPLCKFSSTAAVRFWGKAGGDFLDVVFCFGCQEIGFHWNYANGAISKGDERWWETVSPAANMAPGSQALAASLLLGHPESPVLKKIASVAPGGAEASATNEAALRRVFGEVGARLVAQSDRIEVIRLRTVDDDQNPAEYSILRSAMLGEELGRELRKQLLDARTYALPPAGTYARKLCGEFEPGVGLRFHDRAGGKPLDVLFCFRCGDITVVQGGGGPTAVGRDLRYRLDRRRLRLVDIGPGELQLLASFVRAMPGDAELRELLRRRRSSSRK